jgi:sugar/nucleoside kinase (ribokinase family)
MLDVHARSGPLARGGDVHGHVKVRVGGTSANAAVWAAWSGADVVVIGTVGDDVAGELAARVLQERGVDVTLLGYRAAPTGVMLVMTEMQERSMVADRGANALLSVDDLPPVIEAGAVLISGYLVLQEPGHTVALEALQRSRTELLAVETASWPLVERFGVARFLDETESATVILANEREARVLTGTDGPDAAAALGERYRVAAVKMGTEGASLFVDGRAYRCRGEAVEADDPTGAGDAFDGVLLAALARGTAPEEALDAACRAGTVVARGPDMWPEDARTA